MYDGNYSQGLKMKVSIIIPIKSNKDDRLLEFTEYICNLSEQLKKDDCQIIIADESEFSVYSHMKKEFAKLKNVFHFVPRDEYRDGANDKLNGIHDALNYVKYDNVLLIDDHFRLTRNDLVSMYKYFGKYSCFKTMPNFNKFSPSVLIDLCGMFVVNILDSKKQYCGHLAFSKKSLDIAMFPDKNTLFDELALEEQFRKANLPVGFIKNTAIEATQDISYKKFFEQRVRYAYENLAFPIRFSFFCSILPILGILLWLNKDLALYVAALLTVATTSIALVGQIVYGQKVAPKYTFLFSPLWFWFYPFTTWIAVYKYFTGGITFGGRKIKKAS